MKKARFVINLGLIFSFICLLGNFSFAESNKVAEVYFDRGVQKYLQGDADGFIEDLEKALEANPKYGKAKTFLVKVLVEKGTDLYIKKEFKGAFPYLEKAHNLAKDNQEVAQMYKMAQSEAYPKAVSTQQVVVSPLPEGGTGPFILGAGDSDKYDFMVGLFNRFQDQQSKLIEVYIGPQETLRKQLEYSDRERKEMLSLQNEERKRLFDMLEKKDQTVITALENQKEETKKAFLLGIIGIVLAVIVVIFVMYIILYYVSSRREAILMNHQEKIVNLLAGERQKTDAVLASGTSNLLRAPEERSVVNVREMMENPNSHIRAKGVEILDAQLVEEKEDCETAAQLLAPFLNDPNNRVRGNAVKAVYKYDREKAFEVVKDMLLSSNVWMRLSGIWVIGEVCDTEGVKLLFDIFKEDQDDRVKKRILSSLNQIKNNKDKKISEVLLAKINDILDFK